MSHASRNVTTQPDRDETLQYHSLQSYNRRLVISFFYQTLSTKNGDHILTEKFEIYTINTQNLGIKKRRNKSNDLRCKFTETKNVKE